MIEKVVLMCGAGHSGSTLLGLVLGSHSQAFYGGEMKKTNFLHNPKYPPRKRFCKFCGPDCPVWSDFRPGPGAWTHADLAGQLGLPVVVDSSKDLDWINEHLGHAEKAGARAYLIYLQRDGRAVFNSRVRKGGKAPERLALDWKEKILQSNQLFEAYQGPKLRLRYEHFALQPHLTVERLCQFIGIPFEPAMLEFASFDHHPLGGNAGTQYLVARAQESPARFSLSKERKEYYDKNGSQIRLDLRWREELSPELLALFQSLAGAENQELAWDEDLPAQP